MARRVIVVRNNHTGSKAVHAEGDAALAALSKAVELAGGTVEVYETQCDGDGVRLGQHIAKLDTSTDGLDIVIFGGDGTVSEVVNGIMVPQCSTTVRLAVFPSGTANALYASMYPDDAVRDRSIQALIQSLSEARRSPLTLPCMVNRLLDRDGQLMETTYSILVTSHALHAAILFDADTKEMRAKYEGIERFKASAQLNSSLWMDGSLTLQPFASSPILRYSPDTHRFEPFNSTQLSGPFLYLNAMITDRLESQFIPAPLSSPWPHKHRDSTLPQNAIDLVVIRPARAPGTDIGEVSEQPARTSFAQTTLMDVQKGMYSQGTHIDLVYGPDEPVVEYFRCAAYTFKPSPDQEDQHKARLICMDGTIAHADAFEVRRCTSAPLSVWR